MTNLTNIRAARRGLLIAAAMLGALVLALAYGGVASAQDPAASPAASTSTAGNLPGIVFLLVPLVIAAAVYVSYLLGPRTSEGDETPRREGAVSRTLRRAQESS